MNIEDKDSLVEIDNNYSFNFIADIIIKEDKKIGYAIYYPVSGIIEENTKQIIQLNFELMGCIVELCKEEDIEFIKNNSYKNFTTSLPVRQIIKQSKFIINKNVHYPRLHIEVYSHLMNFKNILNIEKEELRFFSNSNSNSYSNNHQEDNDKESESSFIADDDSEEFNYPGYDGEAEGPNPWKVFGSHLETPKNGGFAKGQFDGHFNRSAIVRGVPNGIVDGNGNRQKFKDLIKKGVVKPGDKHYDFIQNILKSKNSFERIEVLKEYLKEIGKKYDDESYNIKLDDNNVKKMTFFTSEFTPLIKELIQNK